MAEKFPDFVGKTRLEAYENNLDKFASEFHEYEKHENMYGYWKNPNSKWDWYQIGGRWRGFFPVKKNIFNLAKNVI